jgi:hypothetical protein
MYVKLRGEITPNKRKCQFTLVAITIVVVEFALKSEILFNYFTPNHLARGGYNAY